MVVVRGVPVAFLGGRTARNHASLDCRSNHAEIGLGLASHDAAGRAAHVGAVEAEPDAPHQLGHVRFTEAGVGAACAGGRAVEALVDAAQERLAI